MSNKHKTGIKLKVMGEHPGQPPHYSVKLDGDGKPYIVTTWNKRFDITSSIFPQKAALIDCGYADCEIDIIAGLEELKKILSENDAV